MGVFSLIDLYTLDSAAVSAVTAIRKYVVEARIKIRDYELAGSRKEQLMYSRSSKRRLEDIRKAILVASESKIFSPVDVAQLTANVDLITDLLI